MLFTYWIDLEIPTNLKDWSQTPDFIMVNKKGEIINLPCCFT